jgi:hypothetical protein
VSDAAIKRAGTLAISWGADGIGKVTVDGEHWASVEWSEKREQWCIEDVEGRCLRHSASIHGKAASKEEAVALAEVMIRDGRMPDPETARSQAQERRRAAADMSVEHLGGRLTPPEPKGGVANLAAVS